MSAFDKVIGYETIKHELNQICDMIKNKDIYESMGAKLPKGVLLYGPPGLGKTLMAKCFIEESGLHSVTLRRCKGGSDFVEEITRTFQNAKEHSQMIIFLDDMDKFANEDSGHRDAEEYVAIQAGIDEVKDSGVFVIATVNEKYKLPNSLIRSGRFDRKIEFDNPDNADAAKIVAYFLSDKKVSENVDMNDLTKMISYSSCAALESILNDAAIGAAFRRKDCIEMEDLVSSVLRTQYETTDNFNKRSEEDIRKTALHEAGHLVVSETLTPEGVGLVSITSTKGNERGGFVHRCIEPNSMSEDVMISLAGKVATELYYGDVCADGCQSDLDRAIEHVRDAIRFNASMGIGLLDVESVVAGHMSESYNARFETVVQAEIERYLFKVRDILIKNRDFLEMVTNELTEKNTLLFSDIRRIRESVSVVNASVA